MKNYLLVICITYEPEINFLHDPKSKTYRRVIARETQEEAITAAKEILSGYRKKYQYHKNFSMTYDLYEKIDF